MALLSDGGVGSLVVAYSAWEETVTQGESDNLIVIPWPDPLEARLPAPGRHPQGGGPPPRPHALHLARLSAARSAATHLHARFLDPAPGPFDSGGGGMSQARCLLRAAADASSFGVTRLVWGVHPIGGQPDAEGVARAARAIDLATLVERLASLELEREFVLEAPLADLTDGQIAELAADLGVDLGLTWWAQVREGRKGEDPGEGVRAGAMAEEARWREAFESVGLEHVMDRLRAHAEGYGGRGR